jgi:hypothetical protein
MSRPVSAMMVRARSSVMPGTSASRAGAGGAVGGDAPGGGHRRGQLRGPGGQGGDLGAGEGDVVQQQLGEFAGAGVEHAVQGLDEIVVPGLHPGAGQAGQPLGVAFAGDQRLDHVLRGHGGQLGGDG